MTTPDSTDSQFAFALEHEAFIARLIARIAPTHRSITLRNRRVYVVGVLAHAGEHLQHHSETYQLADQRLRGHGLPSAVISRHTLATEMLALDVYGGALAAALFLNPDDATSVATEIGKSLQSRLVRIRSGLPPAEFVATRLLTYGEARNDPVPLFIALGARFAGLVTAASGRPVPPAAEKQAFECGVEIAVVSVRPWVQWLVSYSRAD